MASILRNLYFSIFFVFNWFILRFNKVDASSIQIFGLLLINNKGTIRFGERAKINSSRYKNIIGGDVRSSIIVKKGARLIVARNFKMSNSSIYCTNKIVIGSNVMIGGSCRIWDTDFHSLDSQIRLIRPNEDYNTKPIVIGDNVFIGAFSIILKGITIGDDSIVGAGSVVSKNIPPGEVWAGNPARFVKKININEGAREIQF